MVGFYIVRVPGIVRVNFRDTYPHYIGPPGATYCTRYIYKTVRVLVVNNVILGQIWVKEARHFQKPFQTKEKSYLSRSMHASFFHSRQVFFFLSLLSPGGWGKKIKPRSALLQTRATTEVAFFVTESALPLS